MPSSDVGPSDFGPRARSRSADSGEWTDAQRLTVDTPAGPARLIVLEPDRSPARGTLALGHGAGGGFGARDLTAVAGAARAAGWRVLLVEQPWLVAGRKVAAAPPRLDQAWLTVLSSWLGGHPDGDTPLVVGGRSAGARVACRTAAGLGALAVVALAFPLHPPGRPERSRAGELTGAGVPTLVVQGRRDPFGRPEEIRAVVATVPGAAATITVVEVDGDHGLAPGVPALVEAVLDRLATLDG